MAVVYRTTGALDGSDAGITISLPTLERRLSDWRSDYKCSFVGEHPRALTLVTMYFTRVVIAVDDLDTKTAKFAKDGFYLVEGLHAPFVVRRDATAYYCRPVSRIRGTFMIPQFSSYEKDFGAELLCPACEGNYLHHQTVEIFDCGEDASHGIHVTVSDGKAIDGYLIERQPKQPTPRLKNKFLVRAMPR